MDFKFIEFLKEIIDDALYASIAKLAIAFYLGKKFIEFLISGFNIAYKEKERRKEYIELKKDVADFKIEQKKTNEKLEAFGIDLNAYKKRTHKIENQDIANLKIIERSNDLMEKLNNKL
jgi:hypothetical protein